MSAEQQPLFFVGGYAPATEQSLHAFRLDEATGALTALGGFTGMASPSYLAAHPNGRWLYAASEAGQGGPDSFGGVWALSYEPGESVTFETVNSQDARGTSPCHLTLDGTARWLVFANYGTGSAGVMPVRADGSLGELADFVQHQRSNANRPRQGEPHAHSATMTPDNNFVIICDLGLDKLMVYALNPETGRLRLHQQAEARPGAGPRHAAWHPDQKHLYVANELDSTIALYDYDADSGSLTEKQHLSTLPNRPAGASESTVADIHVTADGQRVLVSNRGDDSLAIFEIGDHGRLSLNTIQPCGGQVPRNFQFSPSGKWVLVANQNSNEVVVLPFGGGHDPLGEPVARAAVKAPAIIHFAPSHG
jgi:6-phosphogluconolactonase